MATATVLPSVTPVATPVVTPSPIVITQVVQEPVFSFEALQNSISHSLSGLSEAQVMSFALALAIVVGYLVQTLFKKLPWVKALKLDDEHSKSYEALNWLMSFALPAALVGLQHFFAGVSFATYPLAYFGTQALYALIKNAQNAWSARKFKPAAVQNF